MAEPVQIQELAGFLDRLEFFPEEPPKSEVSERMIEFKKLVDSNQYASIMLKLLSDKEAHLVFSKGNDTEIQNFFALCGTLLMKLKGDTISQVINIVIEKVKVVDDKKQLRLQILGDLFNLDTDNERRFQILLAVFHYAAKSGQADVLHHQLENLSDWISELKLNPTNTRQLYQAAIQVFDHPSDAFEILIKLLETYEDEHEDLSSIRPFVKEQLLNALKTSEIMRTDSLLQLRAVKDLNPLMV
jgi:hypothetical protein